MHNNQEIKRREMKHSSDAGSSDLHTESNSNVLGRDEELPFLTDHDEPPPPFSVVVQVPPPPAQEAKQGNAKQLEEESSSRQIDGVVVADEPPNYYDYFPHSSQVLGCEDSEEEDSKSVEPFPQRMGDRNESSSTKSPRGMPPAYSDLYTVAQQPRLSIHHPQLHPPAGKLPPSYASLYLHPNQVDIEQQCENSSNLPDRGRSSSNMHDLVPTGDIKETQCLGMNEELYSLTPMEFVPHQPATEQQTKNRRRNKVLILTCLSCLLCFGVGVSLSYVFGIWGSKGDSSPKTEQVSVLVPVTASSVSPLLFSAANISMMESNGGASSGTNSGNPFFAMDIVYIQMSNFDVTQRSGVLFRDISNREAILTLLQLNTTSSNILSSSDDSNNINIITPLSIDSDSVLHFTLPASCPPGLWRLHIHGSLSNISSVPGTFFVNHTFITNTRYGLRPTSPVMTAYLAVANAPISVLESQIRTDIADITQLPTDEGNVTSFVDILGAEYASQMMAMDNATVALIFAELISAVTLNFERSSYTSITLDEAPQRFFITTVVNAAYTLQRASDVSSLFSRGRAALAVLVPLLATALTSLNDYSSSHLASLPTTRIMQLHGIHRHRRKLGVPVAIVLFALFVAVLLFTSNNYFIAHLRDNVFNKAQNTLSGELNNNMRYLNFDLLAEDITSTEAQLTLSCGSNSLTFRDQYEKYSLHRAGPMRDYDPATTAAVNDVWDEAKALLLFLEDSYVQKAINDIDVVFQRGGTGRSSIPASDIVAVSSSLSNLCSAGSGSTTVFCDCQNSPAYLSSPPGQPVSVELSVSFFPAPGFPIVTKTIAAELSRTASPTVSPTSPTTSPTISPTSLSDDYGCAWADVWTCSYSQSVTWCSDGGVCSETAENERFCFSDRACSSSSPCSSSSQCAAGETCVINSCCEISVCFAGYYVDV